MVAGMKTVAIILAGGGGERFNATVPKQFVKLAGKLIIEHTINVFERHPLINEIYLVVHSEFCNWMKGIVQHDPYSKVRKVLIGGATRQESSKAGIFACAEDIEKVLIHDAVRPFVSEGIITNVIQALDNFPSVDVAIPTADTIIEISSRDLIGHAVGQFLVVFCLIYGQYLVTKDVSCFLWGMPYIFLQTISYFNVLKLHRLEDDFYNQNQYTYLDNFVLADNFIQSKFPFAGKIKGHFHSKRLAPNPLTNIEAQTVALFICPMILQIKIGLLLASIISFGETLAFAVFYFLIKWRHKI